MTFKELLSSIEHAENSVEVWADLRDFLATCGITRISYHHLGRDVDWRSLKSTLSPETLDLVKGDVVESPTPNFHMIAHGFPEEWVRDYVASGFFEYDPIPMLAHQTTDPFLWSDAVQMDGLTDDQRAYLEELAARGVGDGIAIQVFGPHNRDGYFGFGFGDPKPELTAARLREFQMAAQAVHLCVCRIIEEKRPQMVESLSPRETEVLSWIARGKSKSVIADILGISVHTVDTIVRRIFKKLDVADRTSAALKGVACGLIPASEETRVAQHGFA